MVHHAVGGLLELMKFGSFFHTALGATDQSVEPSGADVSVQFVINNIYVPFSI